MLPDRSRPWRIVGIIALTLLSGLAYYWLCYRTYRVEFEKVIGLYVGLFAMFYGIWKLVRDDRSILWLILAGLGFRALLVWILPELSDDFWRFIWDGRIMEAGENPFAHTPAWMRANPNAHSVASLSKGFYIRLNSQEYYSVYPPLLQWIFWGATHAFPEKYSYAMLAMKGTAFALEAGTLALVPGILKRIGLPKKAALLYALNPLVIVELTGNLHWESLMIFGLALSIWLLQRGNWWLSAGAFSLAIGAKLLPLMFMPFLIRRLGWKKAIGFGVIAGGLTLAQFAPYFGPETIGNFLESVSLYFQKFEFNASLYYLISKPLFFTGINLLLGKLFPLLVAGLICWLAWKEPQEKSKVNLWPYWMLIALTLYYFLATTVHPWYITTFVFLGMLSGLRYPHLWSFLIVFTYVTYRPGRYEESYLVVALEYLLLYAFAWYEIFLVQQGKTLEEWVLSRPKLKAWLKKSIPARMAIKKDRILRHIGEEEKVMDLGTGNGGLALVLQEAGRDVQSVDVKNISFFEEIQPLIYDGKTLPFEDNSFDTVLLITVLHHTPDPEAILKEARRVSRNKVIVMEDIYSNWFQKELTFFTDSLVNLEFEGHPHTNMKDEEWRDLFQKLGFSLTFREDFRTLVFFRQVIYVLRKES